MSNTPGYFHLIFGMLTLIAALGVVMSHNPVVSAMALMATLFTTGTLYFGMGSFFVGAVQILIYAGAVSVLFVFIVMLLDMRPLKLSIPGRKATNILSILTGIFLFFSLTLGILQGTLQSTVSSPDVAESVGESMGAKTIALQFLSKYMLPFQVTGLMILAAVIGVILLGRPKKNPSPDETGGAV